MDAAIQNQLGERDARDLAPHGIESREDHGLWRVVDDEVHAGRALQCADIAALASDDAALHLVVGQWHDRDGDIRHLVGGAALDGERDDLARLGFGLLAARASISRARMDASRRADSSIAEISSSRASSTDMRATRCRSAVRWSRRASSPARRVVQLLVPLCQRPFLAFQIFYFAVEGLLFLLEPLLLSLNFLSRRSRPSVSIEVRIWRFRLLLLTTPGAAFPYDPADAPRPALSGLLISCS